MILHSLSQFRIKNHQKIHVWRPLISEAKCLRRDSDGVVNTFSRFLQFYNILSVRYLLVAST